MVRETKELLVLLRQLNQEGITILLITHDMEIMASECSRALIMGTKQLPLMAIQKNCSRNLRTNYKT